MPQENNGSKGKNNKNKRLSGQNSLLIRILVGAYLLYSSYSMLDSFINGGDINKYILRAVVIAFAIIGILLIFFSGRDLYRGNYIGGRMDPEDGAEDEKDEDSAQHGDEDQV